MESHRAEVTAQPTSPPPSSAEILTPAEWESGSIPAPDSRSICRVLLVDAHPIFRFGVQAILRQLSGFAVCGEAGTATTALEVFQTERPHMVVLDPCLPEGDGTGIVLEMLGRDPEVAILIVSHHEEPLYAALALSAGAVGYTRKDDPLRSLCSALKKTARHEPHVSRTFRQHIVIKALLDAGGGTRDFLTPLSGRELDVFRCLGQGLDTHEIARQLDLGVKTVDTHRANIRKKLHMPDAASTRRLATEWHAMTGHLEAPPPDAS